jgi:4-hydroxy-tetrahydrodipicolinate synthase
MQPTNTKLQMRGLYPATVAVYNDDFTLDVEATRTHLASVASVSGVKGLVVTGMLAEVLELTSEEEVEIVKIACSVRKEGQLVIAGLMERNPDLAVKQAKALKAAGADALLVFPPYELRSYRKLLSDETEMVKYFSRLDDEASIPLIVFQYPPASAAAYPIKILERLADIPGVIGVKAATGTVEAYHDIWDKLKDKISVLAAVDSPPLRDMLLYGAHGALIGISTITPQHWVKLLEATEAKDVARTDAIFDKICRPLMASVFENQKPTRATHETACVKEALVQLGEIPSARIRPPAVPVTESIAKEIREALIASELLSSEAVR